MILDDKLHDFLLKKIRREIIGTQSILHLSDKQQQIVDKFAAVHHYLKANSLESLQGENSLLFSHVIVDLDLPLCDNFDEFLESIKQVLIPDAELIVIASNLCTWKNKINFWFGNDLTFQARPYRAVAPRFLRDKLLQHGFKIKNRLWDYGDKVLIIGTHQG